MRQIDAEELDHIIRFELKQLGKLTLKGMASHGETRARAIDLATRCLLHRMLEWEIIVPDPERNIFENIGKNGPT